MKHEVLDIQFESFYRLETAGPFRDFSKKVTCENDNRAQVVHSKDSGSWVTGSRPAFREMKGLGVNTITASKPMEFSDGDLSTEC